jgi:hypothetical protein
MEIASPIGGFQGGRAVPTLRLGYLSRADGTLYSCSSSPFSDSSHCESNLKNSHSAASSSGSRVLLLWEVSDSESSTAEAEVRFKFGWFCSRRRTGRDETHFVVWRFKEIGCFGSTLAPAAGKRGLRRISRRTTRPCLRSIGCRGDLGVA